MVISIRLLAPLVGYSISGQELPAPLIGYSISGQELPAPLIGYWISRQGPDRRSVQSIGSRAQPSGSSTKS
ncbi:hypothetical protein ACPXCG_02805 [Gordonia sp. DT218]|uniref:hypothetical protein n=1 Tax=Gordonia sp. DT218 TaxID=3416659 RepID=UPI003CEEACDD